MIYVSTYVLITVISNWDVASLIYGKIPESSSPSKRSTVLKGDRLNEFEPSPFPEIDRFVANSLKQRKVSLYHFLDFVSDPKFVREDEGT